MEIFYGYATNGQGERARAIITAENSAEATTLFQAELIMLRNSAIDKKEFSAYKIDDIFQIKDDKTRCLILL